ncbi:12183_t:CDS:2 [Acaulospora morrowiae]|uniref:12183_t:CDS:1 n=1 Tax=Acaulospora morrowiae TaxID=94023 RepID=A0A9N9CZJ9_9GLOM|nr:12183_t:CDS:2 [Acaulospora morrowiae]
MQELTERKVPRPTTTRFSNAESDGKSEEESRQSRRHWLFGKSENRRGKVVPESTMMKKSHLRTKTNSQAQESECDDDDIPLPKEINICISRQKISMKNQVKNLDLDNDEAVSDSESVEGCHAKCFGLFRRDKGIEGKIVPKNYNVVTVKEQIIVTGLTKNSILNDETNMVHADKIDHGKCCNATDKSTSQNECPIKENKKSGEWFKQEEGTVKVLNAVQRKESLTLRDENQEGKRNETILAITWKIHAPGNETYRSCNIPAVWQRWMEVFLREFKIKFTKTYSDTFIRLALRTMMIIKNKTVPLSCSVRKLLTVNIVEWTMLTLSKANKELSVEEQHQKRLNATNARKMAIVYFNVVTMKEFYMTQEFKTQLIQLVPNDIVTSICGIHLKNQDNVDDTAKKKQIVWEPNTQTAQPHWMPSENLRHMTMRDQDLSMLC